jgi:hypothetical protein
MDMTKEEFIEFQINADEIRLDFRDVNKSIITYDGLWYDGMNDYEFVAMARTDKREFTEDEYFEIEQWDEIQLYKNGELVYSEGNVK